MAKKFLKRRSDDLAIEIDDDLLLQKARGLSFCVRTAFDFFGQGSTLASKALSTYYGFFSLLEAITISGITNGATLNTLEKASSFGHGVKSFENTDAVFPYSTRVCLTNNGFLRAFEKLEGINIVPYILDNIPKESGDITPEVVEKSLSFFDLISRVPTLGHLFKEIFDTEPGYLPVRVEDSQSVSIFMESDRIEELKKKAHYFSRSIIDERYSSLGITLTGHLDDENIKSSVPLYYNVHVHDNYLVEDLFPGYFEPLLLHFLLLYSISDSTEKTSPDIPVIT